MSILSKNSNMGTTPSSSFHEFKKQASFYFKEKIKSARLALTDVTAAELLTEEAVSGNPWAPDTRTLGSISRAAFEVDDYWRIVDILHKRFSRFEKKNWRVSYNSLIVLEHLLTHGPENLAGEFQTDTDVIRQMETFQYIDEKGFDWGLSVRKKSERTLTLLEKGSLLKEERERARKLTRGIQGFGSFSQRSSSAQGILQESARETFTRSHSQFNEHDDQENQLCFPDKENLTKKAETSHESHFDATSEMGNNRRALISLDRFRNGKALEKPETSFRENVAPANEELRRWYISGEADPLLNVRRDDEPRNIEEDHPFSDTENHTTASLLSARDGVLQEC